MRVRSGVWGVVEILGGKDHFGDSGIDGKVLLV
jgi:hypothetical protein